MYLNNYHLKTIIHPTDFSENAAKALEFAIDFSKKFNAKLVILHVESSPSILKKSPGLSLRSKKEEVNKNGIVERLKKYVDGYLEKSESNLKIEFVVQFNSSTAKGILDAIIEMRADLVVVGTKGTSKLKRLIAGSTTKALVAAADCPVLVIPENAVLKDIKQIVYASDYDENDIAAIKNIVPVSQTFNGKILAVHIFKKETEEDEKAASFQRQLMKEVRYLHLNYESLVSADIPGSLIACLKLNQADLLVLFEKENTGIAGLFQKNIAKQLVLHTDIPLMTYNIHSVRRVKKINF